MYYFLSEESKTGILLIPNNPLQLKVVWKTLSLTRSKIANFRGSARDIKHEVVTGEP